MDRFFSELEERLERTRREDRRRYAGFFDRLAPELKAARKLDFELNRHLAHRFNVLKYLRTDELGLSRIIADLLNPNADHGQGPLFLRILLEVLEISPTPSDLDLERTVVSVEKQIKGQRRIDIHLQIPLRDGRQYRLAIENKPYTGDQENQVKDYLEYLRAFNEPFLLIYLSPAGEAPSEWSLPRTGLDRWQGRLAIMPYHGQYSGEETGDGDRRVDEFQDFRTPCALADWLATCREKCQVERLRWFLRDTESFCQRTFGAHAMTTDSDARAVQEYLRSSPDHLKTAQAVYEAWPTVKEQICEQFLQHLCRRIKREATQRLSEFAHDLCIDCRYGGERRWASHLWLYRSCWRQYENVTWESISDRRTVILLEADGKGPYDWLFGVRSPLKESEMIDVDRERRLRLDIELKEAVGHGRRSDWWMLWNWIDEQKRDWNGLLPDLHRECEASGGDITDHYVSDIIDIACEAIPVINRIEGAPSGDES